MFEIQRIKIRSLARVVMLLTSVLYLLCGLLVTLLYSGIRTIALGGLLPNSVSALSFFVIWVGGLVVVLPLSWLIGLLSALLYNLFARWWGGLQLDLTHIVVDEKNEKQHEKNTRGKKGVNHATSDR